MEHLDFVVWMLLYPLLSNVESYIAAKKRQITGEKTKEYSRDVELWAGLFYLILWFYVGYFLY